MLLLTLLLILKENFKKNNFAHLSEIFWTQFPYNFYEFEFRKSIAGGVWSSIVIANCSLGFFLSIFCWDWVGSSFNVAFEISTYKLSKPYLTCSNNWSISSYQHQWASAVFFFCCNKKFNECREYVECLTKLDIFTEVALNLHFTPSNFSAAFQTCYTLHAYW